MLFKGTKRDGRLLSSGSAGDGISVWPEALLIRIGLGIGRMLSMLAGSDTILSTGVVWSAGLTLVMLEGSVF